MKKNAFTLVELVVVIIVIGILAAIALPRYNIQLEKGRAAEAYQMLGSIRGDAQIYLVKHGSLDGFVFNQACDETHYFSYNVEGNPLSAVAERCTGISKSPNWGTPYEISIDLATGALSSQPGQLPAGAADGAGGGDNPGDPDGPGPDAGLPVRGGPNAPQVEGAPQDVRQDQGGMFYDADSDTQRDVDENAVLLGDNGIYYRDVNNNGQRDDDVDTDIVVGD